MNSRLFRCGPVVGLLSVLIVTVAWAQTRTAVVHLKDRAEPIRGQLVDETADRIILKIAGIDTPILKDNIEKIEFEKSLAERFKEKRAALDDDDAEGRFNLARWAFRTETETGYRLALTELSALTAGDPANQQARLLKRLVEQRLAALEAIEEDEAAPTTPETGPTTTPDQPAAAPDQPKMLTEEQRNLLKVYEVNLKDEPRIVIPRNVIDDFLTDYRATAALGPYADRQGQARFRNLEGYEQLAVMFDAQARPLYGKVQIRDEPEPLQTFRARINPRYVVAYFARHFGQQPVPGVNLITLAPNSEPAAYTNFLMLHRADQDGLRFIDRDRPDQSLLLQWGLPRDEAIYPAPEDARNWRPYFTGRDDQRFIDMLQWVQQLYRPSPNYPIDYTPPSPEAETSEPADE